jgi:predicted Zn-dependent protease
MDDLYSQDHNFVFGLADQSRNIGVFSFSRLIPDENENNFEQKFLWRIVSVCAHEIGHVKI